MTSTLEKNIATAALAEIEDDTAECLAVLAQGSALEYFSSQVGRLQRKYGKRTFAVDAHICGMARVLSVVDIAARKLPFEKRADLLSFVMERGMNMEIVR